MNNCHLLGIYFDIPFFTRKHLIIDAKNKMPLPRESSKCIYLLQLYMIPVLSWKTLPACLDAYDSADYFEKFKRHYETTDLEFY